MTPHVTLRPLTLRDTEDAARWGEDPDFCAYAGWTVDRPTADRAPLARPGHRPARRPAAARRRGRRGVPGRLRRPGRARARPPRARLPGRIPGALGSRLGTSIAGAGLDHGFSVLGLREIWAEALDANAPSVRILQVLGMKETGRGDDVAFLGEPTYFRRFATTREAWRARSSSA